MTAAQPSSPPVPVHDRLKEVLAAANAIILGKERPVRLAFVCLIARGHLLIEDLPGVGKTTLAHVLARVLGLSFHRIQFTSDMLPADILGTSVYNRETGSFDFHPGPIFSQVILADEVNRATPRTQSALLEAMEEHQVTIEGETRPLPVPFFVIATQNPSHQIGTFPLPESQLDRFMMRIELGYPDAGAERELLTGRDRRELLAESEPVMDTSELESLQRQVDLVHVSDALLDYLQELLRYTRVAAEYTSGLSPRAGPGLLRCARAWALVDGRRHVLPEDVQAVLPSVVGHRLQMRTDESREGRTSATEHLLRNVPIP